MPRAPTPAARPRARLRRAAAGLVSLLAASPAPSGR